MFAGATSFDQNLSTWDVSSGLNFVSGFEAYDSAASCCLHHRFLILREHSCRCWSNPWCWQYGCHIVAHACNTIVAMLMRNSMTSVNTKQTNRLTIKHKPHTVILFYFTISWSLLLPWWSGTIRDLHYFFYTVFAGLYVWGSYVFQPRPFNLERLIIIHVRKWVFEAMRFCCFLSFASSCLEILAGAFLSLLFISLLLSGHSCRIVAHAYNF
jgi:hypothetical protein